MADQHVLPQKAFSAPLVHIPVIMILWLHIIQRHIPLGENCVENWWSLVIAPYQKYLKKHSIGVRN